ncbi:MAG: DUF1489 domain-containing protein [Pseudomonadota bacterium]
MADGGGSSRDDLNLLKLCVGAGSIADLDAWQQSRAAERRKAGSTAYPIHVTRMWPRRCTELLSGGSLYWVIKGTISVRQRILDLEERRDGKGIRRCAIVLDPALVRVAPRQCRPFQGWRYLTSADAPVDISQMAGRGQDIPPDLEAALTEMGLLAKPVAGLVG